MRRRSAALAASSLALLLLACSSSAHPTPGDAAAADARADSGVCIADDLPCGPPDGTCVGDCRGRTCCSGLCAGEVCAPRNVTFGSMCRDRCGGEAAGTWRVVGACNPTACDGFGAISQGTLTVAVDSTDSLEVGYDFHCGGYINSGGGRSISGLWDPALPTIGDNPYCVDGDRLFLVLRGDSSLTGMVLELTRE